MCWVTCFPFAGPNLWFQRPSHGNSINIDILLQFLYELLYHGLKTIFYPQAKFEEPIRHCGGEIQEKSQGDLLPGRVQYAALVIEEEWAWTKHWQWKEKLSAKTVCTGWNCDNFSTKHYLQKSYPAKSAWRRCRAKERNCCKWMVKGQGVQVKKSPLKLPSLNDNVGTTLILWE